MRRLQQPMHGSQLIDQRQINAKSVQGRPGRIRKIRTVRKRVHIVQKLHSTRQRHRHKTLVALYDPAVSVHGQLAQIRIC